MCHPFSNIYFRHTMFRYTQVATRTWDELSAEARESTAASTDSSADGDEEASDGLEWLELWGVERSSVPEWLRSWQEKDEAVKIKIRKVRFRRGDAVSCRSGGQHHTYLLVMMSPLAQQITIRPSSPCPYCRGRAVNRAPFFLLPFLDRSCGLQTSYS